MGKVFRQLNSPSERNRVFSEHMHIAANHPECNLHNGGVDGRRSELHCGRVGNNSGGKRLLMEQKVLEGELDLRGPRDSEQSPRKLLLPVLLLHLETAQRLLWCLLIDYVHDLLNYIALFKGLICSPKCITQILLNLLG
jgi:hypothetical protein